VGVLAACAPLGTGATEKEDGVSGIEVLAAEVCWRDGYENWPDLTFLLDRMPVWEVFERRPCAAGRLAA
jgi:hypothetical protein